MCTARTTSCVNQIVDMIVRERGREREPRGKQASNRARETEREILTHVICLVVSVTKLPNTVLRETASGRAKRLRVVATTPMPMPSRKKERRVAGGATHASYAQQKKRERRPGDSGDQLCSCRAGKQQYPGGACTAEVLGPTCTMAEVEVPSSAERGPDSFPQDLSPSPSDDLSESAIAEAHSPTPMVDEEEYYKRVSRRRLLSPEGSRRRAHHMQEQMTVTRGP